MRANPSNTVIKVLLTHTHTHTQNVIYTKDNIQMMTLEVSADNQINKK